jgi:hypothetical protein
MVLFMFALTHTDSVWIVTLINLMGFLYALTLRSKDLRGQELGRVQFSQSPIECQLEGLSGNAD